MQYNIPTVCVVPEPSNYGSSTIHEDNDDYDEGQSEGVAATGGGGTAGEGGGRLQVRSTISETLPRPGDGALPGYTFGNVGDSPVSSASDPYVTL